MRASVVVADGTAQSFTFTPAAGGTYFVSVQVTDNNESSLKADIERLATAGITRGCNPPVNDRFCPDDNVTGGQMAAVSMGAPSQPVLVRVLGAELNPGEC